MSECGTSRQLGETTRWTLRCDHATRIGGAGVARGGPVLIRKTQPWMVDFVRVIRDPGGVESQLEAFDAVDTPDPTAEMHEVVGLYLHVRRCFHPDGDPGGFEEMKNVERIVACPERSFCIITSQLIVVVSLLHLCETLKLR